MKLLQINVLANSGSTGRIAEGIGLSAMNAGYESWVAWGRNANPSKSHLIHIGTRTDLLFHGIVSRIFDNQGLKSYSATKQFIRKLDELKPDIIHLHNIHGYYLNYPLFFEYLKQINIPVVWTLHDCWPFTGHCVYFDRCGCARWQSVCYHCPQKNTYPTSYFFDRSEKNYELKKKCFSGVKNLYLIPVSRWLDNLLGKSFLQEYRHEVIHNGIDTSVFSPSQDHSQIRRQLQIADDDFMILGIALVWTERKGLKDFIELSKKLTKKQKIVLIGLSKKDIKGLPSNIIGLSRTESTRQLAELYSAADIFMNLTYEENYPTTNLEAISCGTPCLTYRTGGSIESVTPETGYIVDQGDLDSVLQIIASQGREKRGDFTVSCRRYAQQYFRQEDCFRKYIDFYSRILAEKK